MRSLFFITPLFLAAALAPAAAPPTRPATRPATSTRPTSPPATSTRPAAPLKNLEAALQGNLTVDADAVPFGAFTDSLRERTQTNLVVNWNAFAPAGITKDTPITLHLKDVPFEGIIRTLMEVLPTTGTRANYAVNENTLDITTNAELGKDNTSHVYDLTRAITYSFSPPPPKADEMLHNAAVLSVVFRAELERAGEPLDFKGHDIAIRNNLLVITISARAQEFVNRAINMLNQPLKVGQLASGTQLTSPAKRTQDAYKAFLATPDAATPDALARDPQKYPQFNIALLPGTTEELAKDKPDLSTAINDAGVLLTGPREVMRARTSLAIYDLRDVMKKLAVKSKITPAPASADLQAAIVQFLQTTIQPEGDTWGGGNDLGKKPAILIPYNGLLIVFATAETHRMLAGALQDMNK